MACAGEDSERILFKHSVLIVQNHWQLENFQQSIKVSSYTQTYATYFSSISSSFCLEDEKLNETEREENLSTLSYNELVLTSEPYSPALTVVWEGDYI